MLDYLCLKYGRKQQTKNKVMHFRKEKYIIKQMSVLDFLLLFVGFSYLFCLHSYLTRNDIVPIQEK